MSVSLGKCIWDPIYQGNNAVHSQVIANEYWASDSPQHDCCPIPARSPWALLVSCYNHHHVTTSDFSYTCVLLTFMAGRQNCQPRPSSLRQQLLLFSQQLSASSFLHDCNDILRDAFQCIAQPNTNFGLTACCIWHNISMIQALYQALQTSVYAWERVSEIQSTKGTSSCLVGYSHFSVLQTRHSIIKKTSIGMHANFGAGT